MAVKFDKVEQLTDEQKKQVEEFVYTYVNEHDDKPLLRDITKYLNPEADGRSYLGKVIQTYLDEIGIQYKTTEYERKSIELSEDQKEYISENMSVMQPIDMARSLFGADIKSAFDVRAIPVVEYVKMLEGYQVVNPPKEGEYVPPTTLRETLNKVNRVFSETIYKEKELTNKDKRCLAALRMYLKSPRFARTWKNYLLEDEKEAFESGFIRSTHDKENLTETELNLTIDLVTDQTDLNTIRRQKNVLDKKLVDVTEDPDGKITISLVESINALGKREDETRKRIKEISKSLEGTRNDRLKNQKAGANTFATIMEAWKEEEHRATLIKVAEKNKELLGEEITRLDLLDELKVKIFGIDADELLNG